MLLLDKLGFYLHFIHYNLFVMHNRIDQHFNNFKIFSIALPFNDKERGLVLAAIIKPLCVISGLY